MDGVTAGGDEPYGFDLGSYARGITAASPQAALWAGRGLVWCYGYHHEEAVACFRRALDADPGCPLAHWGVAYASGPNYNMPWELFDPAGKADALATAYDATEAALAVAGTAAPWERALIEALPARYQSRTPIEDQSPWNDAFAAAMRSAHAAHPDDLDIACIFVEAMLNRHPWKMWDLATGLPAAGADTLEAKATLEGLFERDADGAGAWAHPGLLHLHVHLMEMSPTPEQALRQADRLRTLVPDAGHLVHMPTHIDVLCGDYAAVVRWNQAAVVADRREFARSGGLNFYTGYRQHNLHFVIYGAMLLGQEAPAMAAAAEIEATTPRAFLEMESPPMADFFESYLSFAPHVMIRFGRWEEILAAPLPAEPELLCTVTAMWRYARGVAFSALGRVDEAEAEREAFRAARAAVPESRLLHNCEVQDLLAIAEEMLTGELEYRRGAHDTAFAHLRRAVALDDALPYDEPWGWMQPTRHALGALLLEQGQAAEAEAVYRADLGLCGTLARAWQNRDNIWSLAGLAECLERRGDTVELAIIRQKLAVAEARADRPATVSCFCRGMGAAAG